MVEENVNMEGVAVDENKQEQLTDLQEYGIASNLVTLLGNLRKYIILTQIQIELQNKSHQIQPIMREIYQFEETKMIMDIRTNLDTFYAYTNDKIIAHNVELIRTRFEQTINFLGENMIQVKSVLDKNYIEILDEFSDKLKMLTDSLATKSIFDENFRIG